TAVDGSNDDGKLAPHWVEGFAKWFIGAPAQKSRNPPWNLVRNSCWADQVVCASSSRGSVEDWGGRRFKKETRLHAPPYSFYFRQTRAGPTAAGLAGHCARYEREERCFVLHLTFLWEEARRVAAVCQNRRTEKR
ncbi:unnamed protein product, partial [Ectocarpus sp. 13 AM-2016]